MIRFYSNMTSSGHDQLVGSGNVSPYCVVNGNNTAAAIPDDIWKDAAVRAAASPRLAGAIDLSKWTWESAHHLFAATLITHALRCTPFFQ